MTHNAGALRLIAGYCPDCGSVLAVHNNYESWPLVACSCGWAGGTTDVADPVLFERRAS